MRHGRPLPSIVNFSTGGWRREHAMRVFQCVQAIVAIAAESELAYDIGWSKPSLGTAYGRRVRLYRSIGWLP